MMVKTLNQDWTVYFMDNQKEEFPSIKEQGKNLAKFTFEVVKDSVLNIGVTEGEVFASDEQVHPSLPVGTGHANPLHTGRRVQ